MSGALRRQRSPIPFRSMAELGGQDLDFIAIAHSYATRGEWLQLGSIAAGLSPFRLEHLLLRVRRDPVLSLELYQWCLRRDPRLETLENQSLLLHILTKSRRFKPAASLLKDRIISKTAKSSLDLFHAVLFSYRLCDSSPRVFDCLFKTYSRLKKFRDATDTFRRMKEFGFLPSIKSCNALLSSLLNSHRTDIILTFFREMRRCGISPNEYTMNMVMCGLCNSQRLDKAMDLFSEMKRKGMMPMVSTFNTLIDGHCKKGLMESAVDLMDAMISQGLSPNEVTFNTLIHGFCRDGRLAEANKVFSRMKAAKISANTVTYNTLIQGYSQIGDFEMGLTLREEMVSAGISGDVFTYNALILGLCKEGRTKKAEALLRESEREKLSPNASTFSALIAGQCRMQNSERAFQVYKRAVEALGEMVKTSIRPQECLLAEVIEGLHRRSKIGMLLCIRIMISLSK
ncbi:tetratricopeptide repeat (TPR)-like superfamily protein isoform X4 [Wolffia australiana]